ncbi:uncharacterized protein LOC128550974 [Mercenaria mercenaria]|uniref:uncharacterized protein LOC128550974 n=1 Tax=Mercenaria mercenaria TaxID=6596 RepID=UPI00234E6E0C|nr:uncharacterized protein LOC128550974 [Mercenaria mercenaria]
MSTSYFLHLSRLSPLEVKFLEFKKYKDTPPEDIPKDEITRWHDFLENELSKGTTKEGHEEEQPNNEERISMTAQLFNTSDTKPAKSFLKELQKTLGTLDINANVLREFGEADQAKVLIIVFNKNVSENWQAVDKCLSHIEECQYRRIIFIILHVTRKPPRTSVRNLLKSSDFPEQYRTIGSVVIMAFLLEKGIYACDVNDLAFKEIKEFCSKFCSIKSAENEIKGRPSENMAETCSSVANIIEGKDILKPLAYITNPTDTVASNNFTYKLKEEMKTHDIVLSEIQPVEASQIDPDVFLVLVCNNNSRIETHVDRCLAFISSKQYNKTILIVLNIVNKERKPKDFGQYQDIFRIIEMSFTNEKGIYACEMNEKACSELIELFKTHGNTGAVKTNMEGEESPNNTDSCSGKSLDESQKIENAVPVKKKKSDPTE